jgi:paraquat-inducible protein B
VTEQDTSRPEGASAPEVAIQPRKRRISVVWIIPIVAILIGGWLAYTTISEKGPSITIAFETADGLETGKTKVKLKDVEIGLVESIHFQPDLSGVIVTASLRKEMEPHLTEKTRFWVVRPRFGAGGISGLGTLVSGAYVEIDPSNEGQPARAFIGLEEPPLVRAETLGTKFDLTAESLGSFSTGSPLYFRGFKAGQVLAYELAPDNKSVVVHIFVDEPYDALVRDHSRFWDVSGVQVSVDAEGMDVRTQSLEALVQGGIAFDVPEKQEAGQRAEEGTVFALFESLEDAKAASFVRKERVIAFFDGSVRGLTVGAPVEFRGIKMGSVVDIRAEFNREKMAFHVPVLIDLEPERITATGERSPDSHVFMKKLIDRGLRAQLQSGSLLTGQLLVALDFLPDTPVNLVGADDRYPEIPSIPTQIEEITGKVTGVLDEIAALPLAETVEDLRQTIESANRLISSPEAQQVLKNLSQTMADADHLMQTLDQEIGPLVTSLRETSDAAHQAIVQAEAALAAAESLTGEESKLRYDLGNLMEELTGAARSFRLLADYLETHPDALVRGKSGSDSQ